MPPVLFYLHGLNSSPASWKARALGDFITRQHLAIDYRVPALPWDPAETLARLGDELHGLAGRRTALIGSSMGGFYAGVLAERHALPAVLINPVVNPHELLQAHLGENQNLYSGETYVLGSDHVEPLRDLEQPVRDPALFWLLVQTGDETLDHRLALAKYRACRCTIEPGGSHGFDHFERHIPGILAWLGLPLPDS